MGWSRYIYELEELQDVQNHLNRLCRVLGSMDVGLNGCVNLGFEAVREAFVENFARRHELGGACCVHRGGEKAVDLWGGVRNKQTADPWEQNTMVVVHSATKGLAAMTLAIAHSRGCRRGSLERARRVTRSAWGSMRESYCVVSIRSIAAWDNSFRAR